MVVTNTKLVLIAFFFGIMIASFTLLNCRISMNLPGCFLSSLLKRIVKPIIIGLKQKSFSRMFYRLLALRLSNPGIVGATCSKKKAWLSSTAFNSLLKSSKQDCGERSFSE